MTTAMAPFELDHLAIFTGVDAPEAIALEALGLQRRAGVTRHGDPATPGPCGTALSGAISPNPRTRSA